MSTARFKRLPELELPTTCLYQKFVHKLSSLPILSLFPINKSRSYLAWTHFSSVIRHNGKPSLYEYVGCGKYISLNLRVIHFANVQYRLKGKTAIITGGDSGIGRAAAIMFPREGCTGITITHLPEELEDAKDAKASLEAAGAEVNLVAGDLMQSPCGKPLEKVWETQYSSQQCLETDVRLELHYQTLTLIIHRPACAKIMQKST
jgi:short chain dehydrogenase